MTDWSAGRYLQFEDERTRPARDLLARVPVEAPRRVVDVGCGPGNSTELLAARWPDATVTGFDSSPAMLEAARRRLPGLSFFQETAERFVADPPADVVFSNAVLQWTADPLAVMVRLAGQLAPGGVLAVQMPDNVAEPSHRLMVETAAAMPFGERLAGAAREPLPGPEVIYEALRPVALRVDLWWTTYVHPLAGADAVVDWFRSTGLKPFLDRLDAEEQAVYLDRYRAAIAEAYPAAGDGRVLLRFPRLFVVVQR